MNFQINEGKYGTTFTITPETPEEVATLARITQNSKAEKPTIYLSFSDKPYMSLDLRKIRPNVQRNSISNKRR